MAELKISNKLLREAIADAEALRESAIEQAKLSLEEKFTPQIKSMLSRRLRAEAEGTEDATEKPFEDAEAQGSSEMPADTSTIGTSDNKEPSADAFDSSDMDKSGEDAGTTKDDWYENWNESDFDLDEVIKELESDIEKMNAPEGDEEEGEEEGDEEEGEGEESGEEEGEEGAEEKAPAPFVAKETDKVEKPFGSEGPTGQDVKAPDAGGEQEPEMGDDEMSADVEGGDEDLDIEEILRELEAEEEEKRANSERMAQMEKELAEYRKAVSLLRGKLHEVNLLNAKLLYTNKIFRKEGLTSEQKVSIIENFDRATTVREVKMVYTVLVETLTSAAKMAKSSKPASKVVTEGFASRATPSTAPKTTKTEETLVENAVAQRLKQLAGLI